MNLAQCIISTHFAKLTNPESFDSELKSLLQFNGIINNLCLLQNSQPNFFFLELVEKKTNEVNLEERQIPTKEKDTQKKLKAKKQKTQKRNIRPCKFCIQREIDRTGFILKKEFIQETILDLGNKNIQKTKLQAYNLLTRETGQPTLIAPEKKLNIYMMVLKQD